MPSTGAGPPGTRGTASTRLADTNPPKPIPPCSRLPEEGTHTAPHRARSVLEATHGCPSLTHLNLCPHTHPHLDTNLYPYFSPYLNRSVLEVAHG